MSSDLVKKPPSAIAQDFINDLALVVNKYHAELNSFEVLAVLANFVGKLIAVEPSSATPAQLMKLMLTNMDQGNLEVVKGLVSNELAERLFKVPPAGSA